MNKAKSRALGVALLVVVSLLVLPAIVLAGRDSSAPARSDAKPTRTSLPAEEIRADRRASFRHRGCSKRMEPWTASSL